MTRERACLACQGTGRGTYHGPSPISELCYADCPVCLGTGRVVDAITAQDAVADAETEARIIMAASEPATSNTDSRPAWAGEYAGSIMWACLAEALAAFVLEDEDDEDEAQS